MIKKLVIFLLSICLFGMIGYQINRPVLAHSQATAEITLQHQVVVEGLTVNQANQRTSFDLYDMSQLAAKHRQEDNYFQTLKTQSQTIQTVIQSEHLVLVDSQETNDSGQLVFHAPQAADRTYLIVQRQPEYLTQNGQIYQALADPTVMKMSDYLGVGQQSTIQTKATILKRQPYFFKYGRTQNQGEKPLSGVIFVLYQMRQGKKYYLTHSGDWCVTHTPKQEPRVKKILSDNQGLVMLHDIQLPAGQYFFEEVQTKPNYIISQSARAIALDVPALGDGHVLPAMRLNGTSLLQTAAGQLPNSVMATAQPRVMNEQKQQPTPTQLPETGQAKAMMSLIGLVILVISMLLCAELYKKRGINHEK